MTWWLSRGWTEKINCAPDTAAAFRPLAPFTAGSPFSIVVSGESRPRWAAPAWSWETQSHSAAHGTAFHLPGMSAVLTEQIAHRLQDWGRDCEHPSPAPSPLGMGCSRVLDSWPFGLECSEWGLTHLPSISVGKKDPREAACIHPSDLSQPGCLWDFIGSSIAETDWCSSVHYVRPEIPDPRCSDLHPSLINGQELHSEEEVAHENFTP